MAKNAKQDKDEQTPAAVEAPAQDGAVKTTELKYSTARRSDLPKHLQGLEIPFTVPAGETKDEVLASIWATLGGADENAKARALRDTYNKGYKLDVQKAMVEAGTQKDATEATMREAGQTFRATENQRGGGTRGTSAKAKVQRAEAKAEAAQSELVTAIQEFVDDGMPEAAVKILARADRLGVEVPQDLREAVEAHA